MNDIFESTETMQENEHPRFYTAESVMRGHPDKLCDLIADNVLDECLKHDPASRVACEVMATRGHIIVAGEITTKVKPDVFNIVRDTLRDVGYDPKAYQIDCYIHDQSPDIAGAVEPELAEGEDEDTLGAGDQGVMVGYACNETPEYLPMPVVAAQRLVTLLEISRMTGVIPDIGPDGKVQVTMEYNGDTPVRITTVVVSVQHKEDMEQLLDASRDSSFDCIVFPNYCNSHNSVVCSLSCGYNRFPLVEHDPRYTLIVRDILYWETARSLWTQYLKAIPGKEEKVKRAIRGILADYEKEERDIIYLESKNHCVLVHLDGIRQTPEGSPSFYATLDEAEHEFASSAFLRIHKSYLINGDHILQMSNYKVLLDTGMTLKGSRKYFSKAKLEFYRGR